VRIPFRGNRRTTFVLSMSNDRKIRETLRAIVVSDSRLSIALHIRQLPRRPTASRKVARHWLLITLVQGTWLFAVHSVADDRDTLDLTWEAPRECPRREAVLAQVEARKPGNSDTVPGWEVRAQVTRTGAQYRLDLTFRGPNARPAQRSVSARDCAAVADAAAVLIVLALEPPAPSPTANDAPPAVSGSPAVTETRDRAAVAETASAAENAPTNRQPANGGARQPPAAARTDLERAEAPAAVSGTGPGGRLVLELGAALSSGAGMLASSPRFGVRPHVGLWFGRVRAALGALVWLDSQSRAASYPRALLQDRALVGDLMVGFELTSGPLSLVPSVVIESGLVTFEPLGITAPSTRRVGWTALGAGVHGAYRVLGGFELTLDVFGLAPFERPRYLIRTARADVTLFESSALTIRASAGVAYVFE
jgi:hypothetical protein